MSPKAYRRDVASCDGTITTVLATQIGDAATRFTYIDLAREGYSTFSLQHIITATTLTIEACNVGVSRGTTVSNVASGTDGAGATIVSAALNTTHGFAADTDLIGSRVRITKDQTTPTNVGLIRTVTAYAQATGTMTLSAVMGATTLGVTEFILEDDPSAWGRLVSDPTGGQWRDVTEILTGVLTATATGIWLVDTPVPFERIRIRRLTTDAANALVLRLTRGIA